MQHIINRLISLQYLQFTTFAIFVYYFYYISIAIFAVNNVVIVGSVGFGLV